LFLNKVNIHDDGRILRRSAVLSQGWYDSQQGKTFVHISGITVSFSCRTFHGFSSARVLSAVLFEVVHLHFPGSAAFFLQALLAPIVGHP
jgi:hypothetical protein